MVVGTGTILLRKCALTDEKGGLLVLMPTVKISLFFLRFFDRLVEDLLLPFLYLSSSPEAIFEVHLLLTPGLPLSGV